MEEVYCALCGVEIENMRPAYGLTSGVIDEDCCGFRVDSDSDWDIYCPDCMNEIDRLLADFRRERAQ